VPRAEQPTEQEPDGRLRHRLGQPGRAHEGEQLGLVVVLGQVGSGEIAQDGLDQARPVVAG
jgi:hypothetical protein